MKQLIMLGLLLAGFLCLQPVSHAYPPPGYYGGNYYSNWQPYAPYGAYPPQAYYAPPPPPRYYRRPSSTIVIAPSLAGIFGTGHWAGGYWNHGWGCHRWGGGWGGRGWGRRW